MRGGRSGVPDASRFMQIRRGLGCSDGESGYREEEGSRRAKSKDVAARTQAVPDGNSVTIRRGCPNDRARRLRIASGGC